MDTAPTYVECDDVDLVSAFTATGYEPRTHQPCVWWRDPSKVSDANPKGAFGKFYFPETLPQGLPLSMEAIRKEWETTSDAEQKLLALIPEADREAASQLLHLFGVSAMKAHANHRKRNLGLLRRHRNERGTMVEKRGNFTVISNKNADEALIAEGKRKVGMS